MKILHTADWHLGIKIGKRSRIEEQKKVMAELVDHAVNEDVDLVLICGDIFHQAVPSSDAEDLFYDTLERLTANDNRVVIVLAGNHDDPKRLMANKYFAKKHNIVLASDLNPVAVKNINAKIRVEEVGKGYVEITKYLPHLIETAVVALLPYPVEYRINEPTESDAPEEQIKEWARICAKGFKRNTLNIFASHIMIGGSIDRNNGKNEEVLVGGAHVVDRAVLPNADYYALGHIHYNQVMKDNIVYPGAPMVYDFEHTNAGYYLIDASASGVKKIEYKKLKSASKMEQIRVGSIEEAKNKLENYKDEDIVEVTFVQDKPLLRSEIKELKLDYPCLLNVKLELTNIEEDAEKYVVNRRKLSSNDLFVAYYKKKYGIEPNQNVTDLFVKLMEDNSDETN